MTLGKAAGTGLRLLCRALIAAIRSNPIPPRWLLGMAARDGGETPVRLARAAGLPPLRPPAGRYGGDRDA